MGISFSLFLMLQLIRAQHKSIYLFWVSFRFFLPWTLSKKTSKGTVFAFEVQKEETDYILHHLKRKHIPITNVYRFPQIKTFPGTTFP